MLRHDECADLVQLVAGGGIEFPVSPLGEYLLQRGDEVLTLHGECLVYWLRELVFRSAWLDLRLIEGQLEVAFDDETGAFVYFPAGPSLPADRTASPPLLARGGIHPLSGPRPTGSLQTLRLVFKRAFTAYFLELQLPGHRRPDRGLRRRP